MTATAVAMMPYAGMPITGNNTMATHKCQTTNASPCKSFSEYSNLPVTVFPDKIACVRSQRRVEVFESVLKTIY